MSPDLPLHRVDFTSDPSRPGRSTSAGGRDVPGRHAGAGAFAASRCASSGPHSVVSNGDRGAAGARGTGTGPRDRRGRHGHGGRDHGAERPPMWRSHRHHHTVTGRPPARRRDRDRSPRFRGRERPGNTVDGARGPVSAASQPVESGTHSVVPRSTLNAACSTTARVNFPRQAHRDGHVAAGDGRYVRPAPPDLRRHHRRDERSALVPSSDVAPARAGR